MSQNIQVSLRSGLVGSFKTNTTNKKTTAIKKKKPTKTTQEENKNLKKNVAEN